MKTLKQTAIIAAILLLGTDGINAQNTREKSGKLSNQQKETILKEVKATSKHMWNLQESYGTESLQNFMNLVDPDCDQMWQTEPVAMNYNLDLIKTRAELSSAWGKSIEGRLGTPVTITEDYFSVLSKENVLEVNKADYTVIGKDSTTYGPFSMVNTIIWIKRNGEWKMLHCHSSWAKKTK